MLTARVIRGETALDAALGLRARDGATIDPYRACLGLASAAARRGARALRALAGPRGDVQPQVRRSRHRGRPHSRQSRRRRDRRADGALQGTRPALLVSQPLFRADRSRCRRRFGSSSAAARRSFATRRDPPHVVRWVGDDRILVSGADGAGAAGGAARQGRGSAHGPVDVRTLHAVSRPVRDPARLRMGGRLRAQRRRPAVHRSAPQLSAPPVRVRGRQPRRHRGVPGQPDSRSPPSGRRPIPPTTCSDSIVRISGRAYALFAPLPAFGVQSGT